MRIRSYKTQLILMVLGGYLALWGIFFAILAFEFGDQSATFFTPRFLAYIGVLFVILLGVSLWLINRQAKPLLALLNDVRQFSENQKDTEALERLLKSKKELGVLELDHISDEFRSTIENIMHLQSEASKIAAQVAHDIRSPLSALSLATGDLQSLPEEKRVLIRAAVNRINDIANELLEKYRGLSTYNTLSKNSETHKEIVLELLPTLVDGVVSEKRSQFKTQRGIRFDLHLGTNSYGMFAKVNAVQFKRILSNLINNSVEAIEGNGTIKINFSMNDELVKVSVTDNGKGIPKDVLPEIFVEGRSHGKSEGMGLGLFHANQHVKRWGGTLNVKSQFGEGTTVDIELPRAAPPNWFIPNISLKPGQTIAILDDDVAIHLVWQQRFAPFIASHQLNVCHFSHQNEILEWHADNKDEINDIVYLVDFELFESDQSGLDIIQTLGIEGQSILVTSLYEYGCIRSVATQLGVGFIPKHMASIVPIEIMSTEDKTEIIEEKPYVLIDDEELVHLTWKTSAESQGKPLNTYFSSDEFLQSIDRQNPESEIYIDRNLANGVKGEDVAKSLYDLGFKNLYLATGMESEELPEIPWVKGIISKNPPWTTF